MVADDDRGYFTPAADEQTDLPVNVAGKKGQLLCELLGDDAFRRDALVPQTLYLFNLRGAQARRISRNFINGRFPLMSPADRGSRGWIFQLSFNVHPNYNPTFLFPPPSLRDTSASGGYAQVLQRIAKLILSSTFYRD